MNKSQQIFNKIIEVNVESHKEWEANMENSLVLNYNLNYYFLHIYSCKDWWIKNIQSISLFVKQLT